LSSFKLWQKYSTPVSVIRLGLLSNFVSFANQTSYQRIEKLRYCNKASFSRLFPKSLIITSEVLIRSEKDLHLPNLLWKIKSDTTQRRNLFEALHELLYSYGRHDSVSVTNVYLSSFYFQKERSIFFKKPSFSRLTKIFHWNVSDSHATIIMEERSEFSIYPERSRLKLFKLGIFSRLLARFCMAASVKLLHLFSSQYF